MGFFVLVLSFEWAEQQLQLIQRKHCPLGLLSWTAGKDDENFHKKKHKTMEGERGKIGGRTLVSTAPLAGVCRPNLLWGHVTSSCSAQFLLLCEISFLWWKMADCTYFSTLQEKAELRRREFVRPRTKKRTKRMWSVTLETVYTWKVYDDRKLIFLLCKLENIFKNRMSWWINDLKFLASPKVLVCLSYFAHLLYLIIYKLTLVALFSIMVFNPKRELKFSHKDFFGI